MLFKRGVKKESVDAALLGENFNAIRDALSEILKFKTKRYKPTPSHEVHKAIDIEEAWPSCREFVTEMFSELHVIGEQLNVDTAGFPEKATLKEAIHAFVDQMNDIVFKLVDTIGMGKYSLEELIAVNEQVLAAQLKANQLQKFIMVEFIYPGMPDRPMR